MQNYLIVLNRREEPVITGTDVTVACILERLSLDESIEEICDDCHVTKEQVHAALSYAEMNLTQTPHYRALDSMLRDAESDEGLDYSLLVENAGYMSADSCPLRLLHRHRRRARRIYTTGSPL